MSKPRKTEFVRFRVDTDTRESLDRICQIKKVNKTDLAREATMRMIREFDEALRKSGIFSDAT